MDNLTEVFCLIDDFCQVFEPEREKRLLANGSKKRRRRSGLRSSELMTLAVLFHQLRFRQFKSFYLSYAQCFLCREFPGLPSYQRIIELMPRCAAIHFVTPAQRHVGLDGKLLRKRDEVYAAAKTRHPQRWSGATRNWEPITTVHLNPEKDIVERVNTKEKRTELKRAA